MPSLGLIIMLLLVALPLLEIAVLIKVGLRDRRPADARHYSRHLHSRHDGHAPSGLFRRPPLHGLRQVR